ncbi:MotA/TolQ/ExbB proton channel family protein [Sulfitobacter sabulilitoris]|uniref:MotA/TolQ/ExbB proton channel family protein n=1 Tax=Sulfitobacter sabulilitoris TaxID=2562655 RepID=A0A5S3PID6_9RHOB|nr:MotA/TolQ/ExbB proton channel family protein [Sulfitobacter sabulilitoris]TMM54123.1 MotA/TolQ/ExbB proton channel family protein [Sulfitobacter sabulilitoris]
MRALTNTILSGGPIVVVLIVLSLGSIALILVKIAQLRGVTGGDARRSAAIGAWANGDRHAAIKALEGAASPADRIAQAAMQGLDRGRARAPLEAELEWRGNVELAALQRHIRLLELVAMISPLLGLLGTVLGMIEAFQELALAEGAANASLLAGGIWQALLTTAAGLLVAIPAAVAASLLSEKVDRAAGKIEVSVGQLFSGHDGAG